MNFSITSMKQLICQGHWTEMSVSQFFQETWNLFKSTRETFWASTDGDFVQTVCLLKEMHIHFYEGGILAANVDSDFLGSDG
jgi:hypothetical protein